MNTHEHKTELVETTGFDQPECQEFGFLPTSEIRDGYNETGGNKAGGARSGGTNKVNPQPKENTTK